MSKWQINNHKNGTDIFEDGGTWKDIYVMASDLRKDVAEQIVREHNAHAELVSCLKAMLKITCGECREDKIGDCMDDYEKCALSAQARAAIEAAER